MLIRLSVLLVFAGLSLLLAVDMLFWPGISFIASWISRLGVWILLCALFLLLGFVLWHWVTAVLRAFTTHFSAPQRAQRKVFFMQNRQEQIQRLHYFKSRQLGYFAQRKRQHLLNADNRKQIHLLSQRITQDLRQQKAYITPTEYKILQKEHLDSRKQQNIEALLQLQKKIAALTSV